MIYVAWDYTSHSYFIVSEDNPFGIADGKLIPEELWLKYNKARHVADLLEKVIQEYK